MSRFLLMCFLLGSYSAFLQVNEIDSLRSSASNVKHDTVLIDTYLKIATLYRRVNLDSMYYYGNQALALSLKNNYKKGEAGQKNIYISITAHNGKAICEIRDEGPGLNVEDKKKLLGKYQKLSAKPTSNETSTGLGLSIVKKFVVAMKGEIWCESEAGKGASFFVKFELAT